MSLTDEQRAALQEWVFRNTDATVISDPDYQVVQEVVAQTWADVCAMLNERAEMWESDNRFGLANECRNLANAYRTYAEGVGVPSMVTLRKARDTARREVDRLNGLLRERAERS